MGRWAEVPVGAWVYVKLDDDKSWSGRPSEDMYYVPRSDADEAIRLLEEAAKRLAKSTVQRIEIETFLSRVKP